MPPMLSKCPRFEECMKLYNVFDAKTMLYAIDCSGCETFLMYCEGWNDAVKAIEEEKKHELCKKDAKEGT